MSTFTKNIVYEPRIFANLLERFSKLRAVNIYIAFTVQPIKDIKARLPYPNYFPY